MATSRTEALERELFNMKMKCHQYELRLREVNLHGATGETLQRQNEEYRQQITSLEDRVVSLKSQASNLKDICVKSRGALEALQASNVDQARQLTELNASMEGLENDKATLATDNEKLAHKYNEACDLFRDTESQLQKRIQSQEHELKRHKHRLGNIEQENKSQKRMIELHKIQIAEQQDDLVKFGETQEQLLVMTERNEQHEVNEQQHMEQIKQLTETIEQLAMEKEQLVEETKRTREKIEHDSKLAFAKESEKLEFETASRKRDLEVVHAKLERELELVREQYAAKELECERLKVRSNKYMEKEASLSRELARLRADMENMTEHERMMVQQVRDELGSDMETMKQDADDELETVREELRARVNEKERFIIELQGIIRDTKFDSKEKLAAKENQIKELQDELARIKAKWKSSITAKKRTSPSTKPSTLYPKNGPLDKENNTTASSKLYGTTRRMTPSPHANSKLRTPGTSGSSKSTKSTRAALGTLSSGSGNAKSMGNVRYLDVKSRVLSGNSGTGARRKTMTTLSNPAARRTSPKTPKYAFR